MNLRESRTSRRAGILINFSSVILIMALAVIGSHFGWSVPVLIALGVCLVTAVWSFIPLYWNTKLWRLVHAPDEQLDEREILLVRDSLRTSYSVFSITTLSVLLVYAFVSDEPVVIVLNILIYIAHVLPASIIGWKEREV